MTGFIDPEVAFWHWAGTRQEAHERLVDGALARLGSDALSPTAQQEVERLMASDYSLVSRHIATWDRLQVDPGPDRLAIVGTTGVTGRSSQSASIGIGYEQVDQLVIDLLAAKRDASRQATAHTLAEAAACTCVFSCAEDPATRCSLSGQPHVHPDDGTGVFGPCPVHPDAPGDL